MGGLSIVGSNHHVIELDKKTSPKFTWYSTPQAWEGTGNFYACRKSSSRTLNGRTTTVIAVTINTPIDHLILMKAGDASCCCGDSFYSNLHDQQLAGPTQQQLELVNTLGHLSTLLPWNLSLGDDNSLFYPPTSPTTMNITTCLENFFSGRSSADSSFVEVRLVLELVRL